MYATKEEQDRLVAYTGKGIHCFYLFDMKTPFITK